MCNGKYHLAHKADIGLSDQRFYTHCQVCGKVESESNPFCYWGGQYHQKKCYDVLFDKCQQCGEKNMTVPHNEHYHNEKLCDKCYNKNHGLTVVTLGFGPFSD